MHDQSDQSHNDRDDAGTWETGDLYEVGLLLRCGLQPRLPPTAENYQRLLARYADDPDFRHAVNAIASGLGLDILEASPFGLVLLPMSDSPFAIRSDDYPNQSRDDRLIDGLIYVAIMSLVFPRATDLADDPQKVRPSISVEEVESSLRALCDGLATAQAKNSFSEKGATDDNGGFASNADLSVHEEREGLYEAWRVYQARQSAAQNPGGGSHKNTTTAAISRALTRLTKKGCFNKARTQDKYSPTYRFHVLVQQSGVHPLYAALKEAQDAAVSQIRTREETI